ncbi:MAG: OmpA family protein [Thermodesulfobacteriota bacterium]|nr:OmpA family protein [Thermodesulfobacteriota bacterium]
MLGMYLKKRKGPALSHEWADKNANLENTHWAMTRIACYLIIISIAFCACAHNKVKLSEYNIISDQLESCKNDLDGFKKENVKIEKDLSISKQVVQSLSLKLEEYADEKQRLLDENIRCLEDSKMLIAQIADFKDIIRDKSRTEWRLNKDYEYVLSFLDRERLEGRVSIVKDDDSIKIVIPQGIIFPTARSAWLTPKGNRLIRKIAQGIKVLNPGYIEIAGHTDNTLTPKEIKNVYPTNWHLGLARALSVLMVFESQGVQKDKMCAISYGETKPIANNTSYEGRAMNRRAEIIIIP